jgi:hypothetical protein
MSSSTKREVSNDSGKFNKDKEGLQISRKYPGFHSMKSTNSIEAKSPTIVKSSSSTKCLSCNSTALIMAALKSLKVMKKVRTVTIK